MLRHRRSAARNLGLRCLGKCCPEALRDRSAHDLAVADLVDVRGDADKDRQEHASAERREDQLPSVADPQTGEEQEREEEPADEASGVGGVRDIVRVHQCDCEENPENYDEEAPQDGPLDGLEVDHHVGDEEAHHPKDAATRADDEVAGVLKEGAHELPPRAGEDPQQRDAPCPVLALEVERERQRQEEVGEHVLEGVVEEH
mmetsp:Transcript_2116/g.5011  ORF Transcript_2116/g.5011 Transcript_2116/m.5011 type:complete len:202 (+) Transcript_2116:82-687(+)